MDTIFSPTQLQHTPGLELSDGAFMPAVEIPRRAEIVLAVVEAAKIGRVRAPDPLPRDLLLKVHKPDYVAFQETFWHRWSAIEGRTHEALPLCWAVRTMRGDKRPENLDGLLSHYSFDAGSPLGENTWTAALESAATAATAADLLGAKASSAFALCRPPGHHAAADLYGGYCFINNAAIAAEKLIDKGAQRVTILDVDYHHGNGTQALFYRRPDVQFISIHADPAHEFPCFLGYSDEVGADDGEGTTLNLPLPLGTTWDAYAEALATSLRAVDAFGPDVVIISLGLDTYKEDPISKFRLDTPDFPRLGAALASLGKPTLFVLEGGYAVAALGENCAGVLKGFLDGI